MSDWTEGYVADVAYTYGYYTELNPARMSLAFLNAGLPVPKIGTACELGFGQGVSTNVHAAASIISWSGTDFNPVQTAFAQDLSQASGAAAQLFDQAFDQFCGRDDLPEFDFIALHGIWSWISDENRAVIVDFVRRKLKVGGVLYISYNTLPGWSGFAPMRHLLTQHASVFGSEAQGILNRVNGAIDFGDQMMALDPKYAKLVVGINERLDRLKKQDPHYVAHEYFNQHWSPMYFADMADWLEPAKLQFACSANYLDAVNVINLTSDQQKFLANIPDALFRQTVRDFLTNQQFRKDYWVKGARQLTALEQTEALRSQSVILITVRGDVPNKSTGALGEITLNEEIYAPILDYLADHKPHTLAEIEQAIASKGISFANLFQSIMLLTGMGQLAPVQSGETISKSRKTTQRLNAYILHLSRSRSDMQYLASPTIGGAVAVSRFPQLFLLARQNGQKKPEDWAQWVWNLLAAQGQNLIKDGQQLVTPEDNLNELISQAKAFEEKQLPLLKALQIA